MSTHHDRMTGEDLLIWMRLASRNVAPACVPWTVEASHLRREHTNSAWFARCRARRVPVVYAVRHAYGHHAVAPWMLPPGVWI